MLQRHCITTTQTQWLKITIIYSHDSAGQLELTGAGWISVRLYGSTWLCFTCLSSSSRDHGLAWTCSLHGNAKGEIAEVEILKVYWTRKVTWPNPKSRGWEIEAPKVGRILQSYTTKTTNRVKGCRIRAWNTQNISLQRPLAWLKIPAIKITLLCHGWCGLVGWSIILCTRKVVGWILS